MTVYRDMTEIEIKVSPTTLDLVNQKLSELYLNEIIDNKIKDC